MKTETIYAVSTVTNNDGSEALVYGTVTGENLSGHKSYTIQSRMGDKVTVDDDAITSLIVALTQVRDKVRSARF